MIKNNFTACVSYLSFIHLVRDKPGNNKKEALKYKAFIEDM